MAPIVAGRPSNVQTLRDIEQNALKKGGLGAADIALLQKTAKTPEEKAVVQQMLQRDSFDKSASKTNVANRSPVVNQQLSNTTVVRSFSPPEGYNDRSQAIGAARLSGSPNAAVVQDAQGHWHAVETKDPLKAAGDTAFPIATPTAGDLKTAQDKLTALEAADPQRQQPATREAVRQLAALTYGVPAHMINIVPSYTAKLDPDAINVNVGSADGAEGKTLKASAVDGRVPTAVHVSAITQGPTHAATTLFHEGVHASDHEQYLALKKQYDNLDPKPLNKFTKQPATFGFWLSTQESAKKLSPAAHKRAELDDSATGLETHAHLQAFMASLKSDPKTAVGELSELSNDFKGQSDVSSLNAPDVRAFYETLSPADQKAFFAAFEQVKREHPDGMATAVFKAAFPEGMTAR